MMLVSWAQFGFLSVLDIYGFGQMYPSLRDRTEHFNCPEIPAIHLLAPPPNAWQPPIQVLSAESRVVGSIGMQSF